MNCEEKGWKKGEVFEVIEYDADSDIIGVGGIIILHRDDHSRAPKFYIAKGGNNEEKLVGSKEYVELSKIKRIYPPEEESKDITMVCKETGKETVLSRKSAKEMNLI